MFVFVFGFVTLGADMHGLVVLGACVVAIVRGVVVVGVLLATHAQSSRVVFVLVFGMFA